ncbi:amidohydrolase family protein [Actinacidiphila acididurans]|uniref:Amidohydrolase family protein n=1 Tax=Actinacidiphila acididurans TaxID=2784346 RepID=A0ABS2TL15_9ACTN|nr:amidohydrolase family protein [Actinacidiphila acididurans]MBM9504024.1 amidohydrolase family protein [Actinacidiphila acididurans]
MTHPELSAENPPSVLFTDVLVYDATAPAAVIGPTDVLVTGQRIAAVGPALDGTAPEGTRIVPGHGHHMLAPGLINAHFHSPANHLKGMLPSRPLEVFMLYESPADEALRPSPREAYLRTMLAALEMLRGGTTSVQDDAFVMPTPEPDVIDAIMSAYADAGIRATVALDQPEIPEAEKLPFLAEIAGPELAEVIHGPAPMDRADLLDRYAHLFSTWHGAAGGRLRGAVSVSAPQRVGVEYFAALADLGERHDVPMFVHMLETKVQRVLAGEQPRFAGRSLVRYTADLGLLRERTNVIHAVWVDSADLDLIAEAGATVAHNPVSNLRLGSGIMPFREIRRRGIPIGLGVDEAICNDAVDMWSVVRATGLVHNVTGLDSDLWPSAAEVLDCLWAGGARAMGQAQELGAVAVGRLADLVLIDLHATAFTPLNDVRGQLVYCESGDSVTLTMVDGRVVAEGGRVTTVDETALLAEARELFAARRPALRAAHTAADRFRPAYQEMVRRAAQRDVGMNRWAGGSA